MLSLILIMMAGAQAAEPKVIATERSVSVGPRYPYDVRIPVRAYLDCLEGGERRFGLEQSREVIRHEDVVRCETVMQNQIEDATKIWSARKAWNVANEEMITLFVQLKDHHIQRGKIEDQQLKDLLAESEGSEP